MDWEAESGLQDKSAREDLLRSRLAVQYEAVDRISHADGRRGWR